MLLPSFWLLKGEKNYLSQFSALTRLARFIERITPHDLDEGGFSWSDDFDGT